MTTASRGNVSRMASLPSAFLLVALPACGTAADRTAGAGGGGDVTSESQGPTRASQPAAGTTDLTIVINNGAGGTTTYRLTCNPAGGDHPEPPTACRILAERGERALAPVPPGMQCAQVYGGPQTARITGTWQGRRIDSRLSRTNGCESSRWNALSGLLPRGDA